MDQVSSRAVAARKNEDDFYSFAREQSRFILKCACRTCKRFVSESDDEWSVALIAFYEAVRTFDGEKGLFAGHARLVIDRRLKDYFDSQSRFRNNEIPAEPSVFSGELGDEPGPLDMEIARASSKNNSKDNPGTTPLQDEIVEVERRIAPYGFNLYDIGGCSPKSKKTKEACRTVIAEMKNRRELFDRMVRKRNLPFSELIKLEGITKKLLERHRKYLIAATEIVCGDFPLMAEYIGNLGSKL